MSVSRTLAEITATATKAARGAGCAWGLAEEAGMAARVLESHGLPGVAALSGLLAAERSCACAGCSGPAACGISVLAAVADRTGQIDNGETLAFDSVVAPILLAGPLLLAAKHKVLFYQLSWSDGRLTCGPRGVSSAETGAVYQPVAKDVRVSGVRDCPGEFTIATGGARIIDAEHWATLETLAHKTLVPETAESRERGAGPGE